MIELAATIDLRTRTQDLVQPVATAKELFQAVHPGEGFGFPSPFDYARYSFAYERSRKGVAALDVGVGSGQLLNALALGGKFSRVTGIDIKRHSRYEQFTHACEFLAMDACSMEFGDRSFDLVICMEVLEHLQEDRFHRALSELRRVCRGQLLISVPYNEPEPLPPYHKMRFDDVRLEELFPNARFFLLLKPRVPWMLIEEVWTSRRC